ncbi:MAG: TonB-dependent receptor [Porphyromonadaceae bacterium]|nr:MAG: TonB-dependent receptor [Porphyromonadaceae bacterium]
MYLKISRLLKVTVAVIIFGMVVGSAAAQGLLVSGTVSDEKGNGLPGVNVLVKGTSIGISTDASGKYSISVPNAKATLLFSYVGYLSTEEAVNGRAVVNVSMKPSAYDLAEAVVVGYGLQKKSLITGSIARVSSEEMARGNNLRINQALQGKTAGVVIMNNSGQPGDFVSVRIRGIGTNGDAEPLYIVDGLPTNGYGIDYLSPSDIESVEVLKDAASAAIYGARAANGVILITTKRGGTGKTQITYENYVGVQNPWRKLDVLNKNDYLMLQNEAAANAGQPWKFSQAMMDTLKWDTDWQDQMFNYNAPKTNHQITFSGGNNKASFMSSINYYKQDGIVAKGKSQFERFTYKLNTDWDMNFVKVGSSITLANLNSKGIAANDHFAATSLIQALNTPPIVPVTFADGTWATPEDFGIGMQEITNPIAMLSYTNSATNTYKAVGNAFATFDFGKLSDALNGLSFRTSFGGEYALVINRGYTPKYDLDATHKTLINGVSRSEDNYINWNLENVLTYDKTIGSSHFTALLGHAAQRNQYSNVGGSKNDVIFSDFDHAYIDNAVDPLSATIYGGYGDHTMLSYFGRINYDLMGRYLITAIMRIDGSSRFGSANKFGTFPSVSAGWIFTQESFMKNTASWLSFGKLRASWGRNGNESIGDFRYTSIMGTGSIYYFGMGKNQYNGMVPSRIANPSLRWETSEQTDLGLDLGFLNNKMTFTADFYNKTTKDWLIEAPAPLLVGNVPPVINGGTVQNIGFDLELGYREHVGELYIDFKLIGNTNKNTVLDIQNEEQRLQGGSGGFGQADIVRAQVGSPLGVFYGVKTDGIFQNQAEVNAHVDSVGHLIQPNAQPGDFRFVDQNGDGTIDSEDRVEIGNPYPDFTGGLNLTLEYKGFDMNMFWYASLGAQVWDATRRYDMNFTNYRGSALERWTGEGTSNTYPRLTYSDLNQNFKTPSDFWVKNADYLRLRNLSLGYTLPVKVTSWLHISKLRIYLAGENLLTFTKYDGYEPEIGGGVFSYGVDHGIYPQARSIYGGINVTF